MESEHKLGNQHGLETSANELECKHGNFLLGSVFGQFQSC